MFDEIELADDSVQALRDALADRIDPAYLESCTQEELETLFDELEAEDRLQEQLPNELAEFRQQSILTKEQLLNSIRQCRAAFSEEAASEKKIHSAPFYGLLDGLLEDFYCAVASATLPDPLHDWWFYSYEITATGIRLMLNHLDWSYGGEMYHCWRDQKFTLVEVPAKLLTVSEFAQLHGTETVTVRQWIRRGKIRSALKTGKEWRIPELAELSRDRGYVSCRYNWSEELTDLPKKHPYLNAFESALFVQDCENKNRFHVAFDARKNRSSDYLSPAELEAKRFEILTQYPQLQLGEDGDLLLTGSEREELELYLISNPLVHYGPKDFESSCNYQIAEFGAEYCSSSFSFFLQD